MNAKKAIYKVISVLVISAIFFFLGKILVENWQKVKEYKFSFNYCYLLVSFLFLSAMMILSGLIWNKILRILEPNCQISNLKAIKIVIFSWFGTYLPGKAWALVGKVYFGRKEGIDEMVLISSVVCEIIIAVASLLLFTSFLLSFSFGAKLFGFYIVPIIIFLVCLLLLFPKIFCFFVEFILRRFNKIKIFSISNINYQNVIQLIFYYFIVFAFNGLGFFFLIKSLVSLSFYDMIGIIGLFNVATIAGMTAFLAPSGLGIREGALIIFIKLYFPLSVATLISLVARIWVILSEIAVFVVFYFYARFKKV